MRSNNEQKVVGGAKTLFKTLFIKTKKNIFERVPGSVTDQIIPLLGSTSGSPPPGVPPWLGRGFPYLVLTSLSYIAYYCLLIIGLFLSSMKKCRTHGNSSTTIFITPTFRQGMSHSTVSSSLNKSSLHHVPVSC